MFNPFLGSNASVHIVMASDDKHLNKRHTSFHSSSFLLDFIAEYDAIWDGISLVSVWVSWLCPYVPSQSLPHPLALVVGLHSNSQNPGVLSTLY